MSAPPTPIAIVGMGCRFGKARDLHEYWRMCRAGTDAFGPVPADRWDSEVFFDTSRRATDKSYAPAGGWIEDVRTFPAIALGLPPRRVEVMDPQQRLALECALQAIEDAGMRDAMPTRTGVYMGVTAQEWRNIINARLGALMAASGHYGKAPADPTPLFEAVENVVPSRPFSAIGVLGNMTAAAIAQQLDLRGPAFTTDAACASAMVAIDAAITQLRDGTVDAALAGGVYICLSPDHHVAFSRIGAMSPSGRCLPFDHRADGFVQGDGGGVVVLKRLADAERDGDRVYAVIHGSSTNNDGKGDGPMAPLASGQADVIQAAWQEAGQDPARLGYVEAHGTGTQVGDRTELTGLRMAFGEGVGRVALGSSKANVGHTMSAAALAGIVRTALALYHGEIPPMAGFDAPKPELELDRGPWWVPTEPTPWRGPDRLAGVSSFGFGGTNGHLVVKAAPERAATPLVQAPTPRLELVTMSAGDMDQLATLAGLTADAIEADPRITVASVARAWAGRLPQAARLAVVAATRDELITTLRAVARGERVKAASLGVADEAPRVAFLYPGQGSQRTGMLADIRARFPVVKRTLERMERALQEDLPLPLSHLLYPELRRHPVPDAQAEAELTDTANCQPALLSVATALTALLGEVGVRPHVVAGHSLGEFSAAAAAGVISPEEAARFVARRGRAMAALPGDHGAMAAVMGPPEEVEALLEEGVVIANINHPRQVVLSGSSEAIDRVLARAEAADLRARKLSVSHAFHSPLLEGLDAESLVAPLHLRDPEITVASGIADHPYADADDARAVFVRHATSPVRFTAALEQCRQAGANLYLQVGAGGPLASFARGSLPRDHKGVLTLAGLDDHDGGRSLLDTLGKLWTQGVPVDVRPITAPSPVASLPASLLAREDYWPIKDEPQLPLTMPGVGERPARTVAAARTERPAPGPASPSAEAAPREAETLDDAVLAVIARVSAYPLSALKPGMGLVDDLGFDSLMVNDLVVGLQDAFPAVQGIPQELLVNRPSVQDIIDFVRSTAGDAAAAEVDDDAPLYPHVPTWRPAPLPLHGRLAPARGLRVLLVDAGPAAAAMTARLPDARVEACTAAEAAQAGPADLVLWTAAATGVGLDEALATGEWPDLAGPLVGALDRQARLGRSPDLLILRTDDPWHEALSGVARAVAREWPDARIKSMQVDDPTAAHIEDRLLGELTGADRTVDVRLVGGERQVAGLERQPVTDLTDFTADATIVITGGTRGIGARLAARLAEECRSHILLVGRSQPVEPAAGLVLAGRATHVRADVTDRAALQAAMDAALPSTGPVFLVHGAGVLADGALGSVDPARGRQALDVKITGWLNVLRALDGRLAAAVSLGSWAGRFGNRHQAWYAAANALLSGLSAATTTAPCAVAEYGPWTGTEMVDSIPAAVQAAMRAEGVDFVGPVAGLDALLATFGHRGPRTMGRDLPHTTRAVSWSQTIDTDSHPYLLDHAIETVPVLPLAAAADLLATVALPEAAAGGVPGPFEMLDLRLFQGVTVREPVELHLAVNGERAEIRQGERRSLAYSARVRPLRGDVDLPEPTTGGDPAPLGVDEFYGAVTFHGPLLQGLKTIEGVGPDFARGRVRTSRPAEWITDADRARWTIDPLALDSAMQLSATVAWTRYHRAGTPIGIHRYVQLAAIPEGELIAEVHFGEQSQGDRFEGSIVLRDQAGRAVVIAEGVAAELREVATSGEDADFHAEPRQVDFAAWPEIKNLSDRLMAAEAIGIRNPYFHVHEGTARNTAIIEGREFVNYSSYNYIGLSGDERVLAAVHEAVDRYGTSVSASRVASGERPFHGELEKLLAHCQGAEDAILYTAGHATNVSTIGHLMGPEDLILHDELIHDSALQGIKLSGATRRGFKHDDMRDLERQLRMLRPNFDRCLVILEGVYSMDGDICDLPGAIALKERFGFLLMVDEAHSFGILGPTGRGVGEHYGVDGGQVDLWMGTLSKSLASCGGWIAGRKVLIDYLKYTSPGFVYSAGLTAANGVAALAALKIMLDEPWRVKKLQDNARFFHDELERRGLDTGPAAGESGVVPVVTGNSVHALWLSQRLVDQGVNVQPIVYPAVADDAARLRFFLSSTHTREQLAWTAETVASTLAGVRADFPMD